MNGPVEATVDELLEQIAKERGITKLELLKEAAKRLEETPGAKVASIMTKPQVTVDGKTNVVSIARKGVMKGFGKGFREAVTKGQGLQTIGAEFKVGQYPDGHVDAGKWAIQIMLSPFDTRELANKYCDQVTPFIEGMLGAKAIVS